jgi:hypothetical protein
MTWLITALKDEDVRKSIRDVGVILLFGLYMYFNHIEKMESMRGEATKMVSVLERQVATDIRQARAIEAMVETYTGKKVPAN